MCEGGKSREEVIKNATKSSPSAVSTTHIISGLCRDYDPRCLPLFLTIDIMGLQLSWESVERIATFLLEGNRIAVAIAIVIAFGAPLLIHWILYQVSESAPLQTFVLLGPSGAGKTSLLRLLEARSLRPPEAPSPLPTHTSQVSTTAVVTLAPSVPTESNRYRSVNDPSLREAAKNPVRYRLRDTPGHGKLRESQAIHHLGGALKRSKDAKKERIRGIIFVVDAAALTGEDALRDAATYLHDVLLLLQKRALAVFRSSAKTRAGILVLVAANKQDLFTALPPGAVRAKLEAEIENVRKSKSRSLIDASADLARADEAEEEMLGGDAGAGKFSFRRLAEELGIQVDVVGGAVKDDTDGAVGSGVRSWEEWIGMCL